MKVSLNSLWVFSIVIYLMPFSNTIMAQPGPGHQWLERVLNYRYYFSNARNPEYGDYPGNDCAHYGSQLANAGCAGMCEYNHTNNVPGYYWTYLADCVVYWNQIGQDLCHDCPMGAYHQIISLAYSESQWFYINTGDWPLFHRLLAPNEGLWDVPDDVSAGWFGCLWWRDYDQVDHYHIVMIGNGAGPYSTYTAHSSDHYNEPISTLFNPPGGTYQGLVLYGQGPSPANVSEIPEEARKRMECQGGTK